MEDDLGQVLLSFDLLFHPVWDVGNHVGQDELREVNILTVTGLTITNNIKYKHNNNNNHLHFHHFVCVI